MSELKEVPEGSERTVDGCSRVGLPSTRADRRELVGLPGADPCRRDVHERSPGAELRLELIQVELVEWEGPLPRLRLEILLDGLAERHQCGRLRLLLLDSEQIRSERLLSVFATPGRVHHPDLSHPIRVKRLSRLQVPVRARPARHLERVPVRDLADPVPRGSSTCPCSFDELRHLPPPLSRPPRRVLRTEARPREHDDGPLFRGRWHHNSAC